LILGLAVGIMLLSILFLRFSRRALSRRLRGVSRLSILFLRFVSSPSLWTSFPSAFPFNSLFEILR